MLSRISCLLPGPQAGVIIALRNDIKSCLRNDIKSDEHIVDALQCIHYNETISVVNVKF